jgi:hypothetical protein
VNPGFRASLLQQFLILDNLLQALQFVVAVETRKFAMLRVEACAGAC